MINRPFDILVVGRTNADLILDGCKSSVDEEKSTLTLQQGENKFTIPTDKVLSEENDKVTSLKDLDEITRSLEFLMRWGGGGYNSASIMANSSVMDSKLGVTYLTPMKPEMIIGGEKYDLVSDLDDLDIAPCCLNFNDLNFNLVWGGKNKRVVRNAPKEKGNFKLSREHKEIINAYMCSSEGILINALNHADMTEHIVQRTYRENLEAIDALKQLNTTNASTTLDSSQFFEMPQYRKVMTVVTPSSELPKDRLVQEVVPYTGLIFNEDDLLQIFYGEKYEDEPGDERRNKTLEAIAEMRNGVNMDFGTRPHVMEPNNRIYVSLGREGYLVCEKDHVYHFCTNPQETCELDQKIEQNKGSTTGAGDALAAGIIYAETTRKGSDLASTAALVNTVISSHLGLPKTIHTSEVNKLKTYSLSDHYNQ